MNLTTVMVFMEMTMTIIMHCALLDDRIISISVESFAEKCISQTFQSAFTHCAVWHEFKNWSHWPYSIQIYIYVQFRLMFIPERATLHSQPTARIFNKKHERIIALLSASRLPWDISTCILNDLAPPTLSLNIPHYTNDSITGALARC